MTTAVVDRVRIFDRTGTQLTEFSAAVARSWAVNMMGQASMELPSNRKYVRRRFLKYGNWLLVESNLLQSWVGVIDTPRDWSANTVTVNAYSPEKILEYRTGPLEEDFTGTGGQFWLKFIRLMNQGKGARTIVKPGSVWKGGPVRTETLNPNKVDADLKRITEAFDFGEYRFRPVVGVNSGLKVFAQWRPRLGRAVDYYLVHGQGGNLELKSEAFVEDGPIVNKVTFYGDGEVWSEKPSATAYNHESIEKYGLRAEAIEDKKTTDLGTLQRQAELYVHEYGEPVRRLSGNALNVGATFKKCRLGNRMKMILKDTGFRGGIAGAQARVRIIGMGYDPNQGQKLKLILEELRRKDRDD